MISARTSRPRLPPLPAALLAAVLCACTSAPSVVDAGAPDEGIPDDGCPREVDTIPVRVPRPPRWAFEPWISKDISSTDDTYAFVAGFRARDIPVGVVVLDSPWETHYNTFIPHPVRYHDFPKLSADLHKDGVRLVMWITSLVNTSGLDLETGGDKYIGPAPNYEEGARCGFYLDRGTQYVWWKGAGSAVDLFNPRAAAWWHRQQDGVLPYIDGWKLDFGESYIPSDPVDTAIGERPLQEYSELYYRDFLAYFPGYQYHRRGEFQFPQYRQCLDARKSRQRVIGNDQVPRLLQRVTQLILGLNAHMFDLKAAARE